MTQNALRKEPETQTDEQVSEALSSIRNVIKQNLEQGFDHFDEPHEKENEGDSGQGAGEGQEAEYPFKKEHAPAGVPLKTKESLETLIKESERKDASLKKPSGSADVFILTQVLEEDGSVTNLAKKETGAQISDTKSEETEESDIKKIELTQVDEGQKEGGATVSAAASETAEKEELSEQAEASEEAEADAPKRLSEEKEMKEDVVATDEPEAELDAPDTSENDDAAEAETTIETVAEFEEGDVVPEPETPVNETDAEAEAQEAPAQDVAKKDSVADDKKLGVPAPKFSEAEALLLDKAISETVGAPEAPAGNFEIGVENLLKQATKAPVEDLASKETMAESAAAFSELADIARRLSSKSKSGGGGDGPSGPVTPERVGGYTVEELMRELLRPMLKDWLDTHLPSLVKWLVTEQIEKMLQGQGISTGSTPVSKPAESAPITEKPGNETTKAAADTDLDAESMDFDAPGDTSVA